MYTFITILILLTSLLLILIVLVQNSKGGGLAAGFSSSNQIMGAPKTADFLEKATWTLAVVLFVLCVASTFVLPTNNNSEESMVKSQVEQATQTDTQTAVPGVDAPAPTTTPQPAAPATSEPAPAK